MQSLSSLDNPSAIEEGGEDAPNGAYPNSSSSYFPHGAWSDGRRRPYAPFFKIEYNSDVAFM